MGKVELTVGMSESVDLSMNFLKSSALRTARKHCVLNSSNIGKGIIFQFRLNIRNITDQQLMCYVVGHIMTVGRTIS